MHLILLPGMDGTSLLFEPLMNALPPRVQVTAVAYPKDQALGYTELLPYVEATIPNCDFVVLGESFSGPLALMLAAKQPKGLRGVVLCASFIRFPMNIPPRWRTMIRPWMFRWQPLSLLTFILLGKNAFGPLGAQLRAAVRSVSPCAMAARALSVANVDVTEALRTCPVPILYLQAAQDWVIRPGCGNLIQAIRPDVPKIVLPGPHLVLQVSPQAAAETLDIFFRISLAE